MGLSLPSHHIKGQSTFLVYAFLPPFQTAFDNRLRADGANGGPDLSHGKRGKDTVLLVPLGTMLRSMDEPDDDDQWMDMFDGDVDPGADDVEEVGNGVGGSEDADGDEGSDVVHAAGAGGNDGLVDEVDSSGNNDALDDVEGVTDEKKREFNVICDLVENGQQVTVAEVRFVAIEILAQRRQYLSDALIVSPGRHGWHGQSIRQPAVRQRHHADPRTRQEGHPVPDRA